MLSVRIENSGETIEPPNISMLRYVFSLSIHGFPPAVKQVDVPAEVFGNCFPHDKIFTAMVIELSCAFIPSWDLVALWRRVPHGGMFPLSTLLFAHASVFFFFSEPFLTKIGITLLFFHFILSLFPCLRSPCPSLWRFFFSFSQRAAAPPPLLREGMCQSINPPPMSCEVGNNPFSGKNPVKYPQNERGFQTGGSLGGQHLYDAVSPPPRLFSQRIVAAFERVSGIIVPPRPSYLAAHSMSWIQVGLHFFFSYEFFPRRCYSHASFWYYDSWSLIFSAYYYISSFPNGFFLVREIPEL